MTPRVVYTQHMEEDPSGNGPGSGGKRGIACARLVQAGLAAPLPPEVRDEAILVSRKLLADARKAGRQMPRVPFAAARLCQTGSFFDAAAAQKRKMTEHLPPNSVVLLEVQPAKRLRGKSSIDDMLRALNFKKI